MYFDFYAFFGLSLFIGTVFSIGWFILKAIALYDLSRRRGYKNAWLSFIPVVNSYVLGGISDNISLFRGKKSTIKVWLLAANIAGAVAITPIAAFIMDFLPNLGYYNYSQTMLYQFILSMLMVTLASGLISLAATVLTYVACYKIYSDYVPRDAVLYLVLSLFFPFLTPIFLFVIRKKPAISLTPPPQGAYYEV